MKENTRLVPSSGRFAWLLAIVAVLGQGSFSAALGQEIDLASDGSDGALNIVADTVLDLPPDGVLNLTTLTVAEGVTLSFNRNPLNTPVYLVCSGAVEINGTIDVSGGASSQTSGGAGGPGGFDGGEPGFNDAPPGAGLGPGGGLGGPAGRAFQNDGNAVGPGAYLNAGTQSGRSSRKGTPYGSGLLVPLVGGSGGGGTAGSPGRGGGGGGGAILVGSNVSVHIGENGAVVARGGADGDEDRGISSASFHGGSGGAIRIVAPVLTGNGRLNVEARTPGTAGDGRIRLDVLDRRNMAIQFEPIRSVSAGVFLRVFPEPNPELRLVEVAGTTIPEDQAGPVRIFLPFGSSPERNVIVQARNFTGIVPVRVRLYPGNGDPVTFDTEIDMSQGNPVRQTVNVVFPVNVGVTVNAWTRRAEAPAGE